MLFINDLVEVGDDPHVTSGIPAREVLKPYRKDPSYYIAFTGEDSVDFNPDSDFDTPLGIFAYPLKAIWDFPYTDVWHLYFFDIKYEGGVPYKDNRPYAWLLKVKPESTFVHDMYLYSSRDSDDDEEKLLRYVLSHPEELKVPETYDTDEALERSLVRTAFERVVREKKSGQFYRTFNGSIKELRVEQFIESGLVPSIEELKLELFFNDIKDQSKPKVPFLSPVTSVWSFTRALAQLRNYKQQNTAANWNFYLREVLGYDGFCDWGRGRIHRPKPVLAIFFTKTAFTVEKQFYNKAYTQLEECYCIDTSNYFRQCKINRLLNK